MHMLSMNAEVDAVVPLQSVLQRVVPFGALAGISEKTLLCSSSRIYLSGRFIWRSCPTIILQIG